MRLYLTLYAAMLLSFAGDAMQAYSVAPGRHCSVMIGDDGVYTCGAGDYGRLGHGDFLNQLIPKKIENIEWIPEIIAVASSGWDIALHDVDGKIWIIEGINLQDTRDNQAIVRAIEGLPSIRQIVGGGDHFYLIDENEQLWNFKKEQWFYPMTPKLFAYNDGLPMPRITEIAVGYYHYVLLDQNGDVWTFGDGTCGRLGHGDIVTVRYAKKIENVPSMPKITKIEAGSFCTILLDQEGGVWWCGNIGEFNSLSPVKIEDMPEMIAIAAKSLHVALLDIDGEVWTMGAGEYGQLGHGDQQPQAIPKKIERVLGMPRVIAVRCGDEHTILIDENLGLWSFGSGEKGMLGHGDESNQLRPKRVENFLVKDNRRSIMVKRCLL